MEFVFLVKELVRSGNYRLTFHAEIERDADCISIVDLEEALTHEKCEKMKTCPFCKGDIDTRKINHMHKWGDEFYLFKNIKAEVCKQCGEVFFFSDTLKLIDKYVVERKRGKKTISVPVIEMSDMIIV